MITMGADGDPTSGSQIRSAPSSIGRVRESAKPRYLSAAGLPTGLTRVPGCHAVSGEPVARALRSR